MMRLKIISPALLLITLAGFGEAKGKSSDLTGSWKETGRYTAAKAGVSYTDTIRIDFLIGNEYTWQKDMGFMNRGTYKITGELLDLGTRVFTIIKRTDDRIELRNDAGVYEFSRYNKNTGEDNSRAGSTTRAYNPDAQGGPINKAQLTGKWEVYKRTSAVQQASIDYTRILKSVTITLNNGKIEGSAKAAEMKPGSDTWTIDRFDNGTLYCSGPDKRTFKVVQVSAQELILQEGDLTYFFKVFR